jgi:hypothetical protein
MSGIEEAALAAWIANATADSALVYGGLAAGEGTAAAALGTGAAGALTGAGATAAASYGGASMAEQLAMQRAIDLGGTAVAQNVGYGGEALANMSMAPNMSMVSPGTSTSSLLNAGSGSAESSLFGEILPGQLPPSQLTGYEKFMRFGKQGLDALGKSVKGLPAQAATGLLSQSLGGKQTPPPAMPSRPSGGGAPPASSVSLLGQQQPMQVQPYAPIFGAGTGDDAEMRRRKLMMQQRGYA